MVRRNQILIKLYANVGNNRDILFLKLPSINCIWNMIFLQRKFRILSIGMISTAQQCCSCWSPAVPCVTLPYLSVPCVTLPFHTFPYRSIPFRTFPYHSVPFHTFTYHSVPFRTLPYLTGPYRTLPNLAVPYRRYITLPYMLYWNMQIIALFMFQFSF